MEEIWKDIEGYEGLYQISNLGNVKSLNYMKTKAEQLLKLDDDRGYKKITLKGKKFKVHRLVAKAFIPNPNDYPCVNHKDENHGNNCVDNLEWCTYEYNNNYGTIKQRLSELNGKPIGQFNKDTMELIATFNSSWDAARHLKISNHIVACCLGQRKTCGGYVWKYL